MAENEESAMDQLLGALTAVYDELVTLNAQLAKLSFLGSNSVLTVKETTPT